MSVSAVTSRAAHTFTTLHLGWQGSCAGYVREPLGRLELVVLARSSPSLIPRSLFKIVTRISQQHTEMNTFTLCVAHSEWSVLSRMLPPSPMLFRDVSIARNRRRGNVNLWGPRSLPIRPRVENGRPLMEDRIFIVMKKCSPRVIHRVVASWNYIVCGCPKYGHSMVPKCCDALPC